MTIIAKTCAFLQLTIPVFPKKLHTLYEFGFKTLSMQRIVSLNSNARSVVGNTHTAESKIYRLTKKDKLLHVFPKLVTRLKLIADEDKVVVDFSDFNGMHVLLFAKQTRVGRTLPLYFEEITYPIETGSQNIFIIQAIKHFLALIGDTRVSLVFDRGFACPAIVKFLAQNRIKFYIRIKKNKKVLCSRGYLKAGEFQQGTYRVSAYERSRLSLTVTPKPINKKTKSNEPWYIISNDLESSMKEVQDIYYYRFEIEELFKDSKRIFGLEYVVFKKEISFAVVLWFVILGVWFVWYLHEVIAKGKKLMKKLKDRYSQGLVHYWLEQIKFALWHPVLAQITIRAG